MSEISPRTGLDVALASARGELERIETPAEAKDLYDRLETLSQYAKRYRLKQDAQNEIADVKLRTARKGGALLAPIRFASRRGRQLPEGMTWNMSSRWQAIEPKKLPEKRFDEHVRAVKTAGEDLTLTGVLSLARRLAPGTKTPPLPVGTFTTIVADPPWPYSRDTVRPDESGPRAAGTSELGAVPFPYPTMTIEAIAALEVEERAADDSCLYLWTTNHFLEAGYDVARAWGFEPSTLLVWCKQPMGIGLGGTFTITTEFVVFARRGSCKAAERIDTTWFAWKRGRRHSAKPADFFALVERISPEPRLEMFARRPRDGWTVWGDEVAP